VVDSSPTDVNTIVKGIIIAATTMNATSNPANTGALQQQQQQHGFAIAAAATFRFL
ncbi:unnamed protein product, partial [Rotaria sordida]